MSHSNHRWLLQQLPQWEKEGLVTSDSARILRERHESDATGPGLAQIAMGALGSLLIGTGLIAVIGYNWDDFSRPVRLLFAFLPLLATQLFSLRVLQQRGTAAAWVRETAALLQAMAAGACIAIVSQIYNLGGEWQDFLFWWFLLSLPLAWLLRSHAVAMFYLIAIAIWSSNQVDHGRAWHDSPWLYPVLLLGLVPYWPGWPKATTLSLSVRWVMVPSAMVGFASLAVFVAEKTGSPYGGYDGDVFVWLWALTAAAILLFPLHEQGIAESTGRKPQVVLGTLWLAGYGIAATFGEVSDDIMDGVSPALSLPWCWALLGVLAAFAVFAVRQHRWAVLAIASIALLPLLLAPTAATDRSGSLLSGLATLHLSAVGITLIVLEFLGKRGAPRLGAALLCVVIIARMADSHLSLLVKGLAFIAVGVAFLTFNFFMARRRRQVRAQSLASA